MMTKSMKHPNCSAKVGRLTRCLTKCEGDGKEDFFKIFVSSIEVNERVKFSKSCILLHVQMDIINYGV